MLGGSRRTFAALALAAGLSALLGGLAADPAAADDKTLAQALRAGGLVIVLRHGATSADQVDVEPVDFDNIAAQRNLNDKGKAAAVAFGNAFRQIGVPVGKVYTSRFNRAYETATLAGFKEIEKTPDLTYARSAAAPDKNITNAEAFRKLLGTAPRPGTNTVLVTHTPNIVDALGKDWDGVKEGEASIFRPANGNYTLVARVQIDEWPRIAAAT
jgi:broad specificity phosphatase PhoE